MKYAIKYQNIILDDKTNILIPKNIVKGEIKGNTFITTKTTYSYITDTSFDSKYIIGPAHTIEELKEMYLITDEFTEDEIIGLYEMEEKEKFMLSYDGKTIVITPYLLSENEEKLDLFSIVNGETSVILNDNRIKEIIKLSETKPIEEIMNGYKDAITKFKTINEKVKLNFLELTNTKEISATNLPFKTEQALKNSHNNNTEIESQEFTVQGLYQYLKEHIVGHDKELKKISTILLMNYYSNPIYGTESILIPGPTGTGKTATFNTASKYFNIPFKNINTINIVPEGIVGTTIEDEFSTLIEECNGDIKLAEKAIIVFDEFDKLGIDSLETKTSLTNIFLKVLEGGRFPIVRQMKQTQIYNTSMSSKICLGTFTEAYKKDKATIGFDSKETSQEHFDKNLLVKKGYFSSELLTRFNHFIPYNNLTDEDKMRIILFSKLSTYLLKKERFQNQFGITITGDEEFAKSIIEKLKSHEQSIRDVNNIISDSFLDIEYEILSNPQKYKTLKLTKDTISKGNYDLS